MNKEISKIKRNLKGTVVGVTKDKTIKVRVDVLKWHKKYKKQFQSTTHFLVHDEKMSYKPGDVVEFVECRPLSKMKRWKVVY